MLFNELQNLMIKHRFRPNKKIAQHFIIDERVIETLIETADLKKTDTVLEIGPGTGFLTRKLLEKSKVVAIEIDKKLCDLLEQEMPKGLELLCQDFLKASLPEFNKVVSLPPYSHSAEIMHKLLEHDFDLAVLVFQKEFAEKLAAFPGYGQYSALSVLTQSNFEAKILKVVPSGVFFPKPKDESCILVLKKNEESVSVKDKALFSLFMKTVFRFRNKNLKNALSKGQQFLLKAFGMSKKEFEKRSLEIDLLDEKVDLIPVEDFVKIFTVLTKASQ